MIEPSVFPTYRSFSLILICAMLGACATTQKSSTGSGEQTAAPISEAAKPQTTAKPGETSDSPATGTAGVPATSTSSSTESAAAGGATGAASGNAGAEQGSSDSSAASSDNEEAVQLKRQLAEQDAQIDKLRSGQQAGAGREEADATMQREQQSAAAATEQPASPGAAATTASKSQDEMAVFPANDKAEESAGSESVVQRAPERSVYFGYNQSSIAEKYDSMLLANAAYLKAHPTVKTEVQGNCDERGSREYNLALGARRAESVKRALELAGADGGRISAISYGSEKPVATGKDEESYSQNRRADIVY
jgi:peptidoglycan-associated lipoprotein